MVWINTQAAFVTFTRHPILGLIQSLHRRLGLSSAQLAWDLLAIYIAFSCVAKVHLLSIILFLEAKARPRVPSI